MVGALQRGLVCRPRSAGWSQPEHAARWRDLGFHHAPDFATAQAQHDALCRELENAGAEVIEAPPAADLSLDAAYAHDASLATDFGLIVMRPGKSNRVAEGRHHGSFCETLGISRLGTITAPGATEPGDLLWVESKTTDSTTLLIGHGYRTNVASIQQMRQLLAPP